MDDKNLGHLCLEAHSHKANKRHIIEQLRPALTTRCRCEWAIRTF